MTFCTERFLQILTLIKSPRHVVIRISLDSDAQLNLTGPTTNFLGVAMVIAQEEER